MIYKSGFLISKATSDNNVLYQGIEGDAWPLDRKLLEENFSREMLIKYDEQLDDLSVFEEQVALLDKNIAQMYVDLCNKNSLKIEVKYIEIIREYNNIVNNIDTGYVFLGYDVGICAFDYYSAVLSDIITRPTLFGVEVSSLLNSNGLFDNISEAYNFIEARQKLIEQTDAAIFEGGCMDVIKVYRVLSETQL